MDKSDEELMTNYARNDDFSSFEFIYHRYSGKVLGYLMSRIKDRDLSEEIHQSVFLKLHLVRSQYQAGLPFGPWFFTIVRTMMIDHLRKWKVQGRQRTWLNPEELEQIPDPQSEKKPEPDLEGLKKILTPTERKDIELRYEKEWSFEQIARHLELSEAGVRKRISRALKKMRRAK